MAPFDAVPRPVESRSQPAISKMEESPSQAMKTCAKSQEVGTSYFKESTLKSMEAEGPRTTSDQSGTGTKKIPLSRTTTPIDSQRPITDYFRPARSLQPDWVSPKKGAKKRPKQLSIEKFLTKRQKKETEAPIEHSEAPEETMESEKEEAIPANEDNIKSEKKEAVHLTEDKESESHASRPEGSEDLEEVRIKIEPDD